MGFRLKNDEAVMIRNLLTIVKIQNKSLTFCAEDLLSKLIKQYGPKEVVEVS